MGIFKKNRKKGYISIEAIIIVGITLGVAILVFWSSMDNNKKTADNIGNEIASTDTYMGAQLKNAYQSDYGGADLDEGWSSDGGGLQGDIIPTYTLIEKIGTADSKTEYWIKVGETLDLNLNIFPTNASMKTLSWRVMSGKDNTSITRNEDGHIGEIIGEKAGQTAVKITSQDGGGASTTIYFHVTQPVTGLKLDKSSVALSYNGTKSAKIKATVLPDTGEGVATEKRVSWSFGANGATSECFNPLEIDYKTNTVTISLRDEAYLQDHCKGQYATLVATTEDGGFTKTAEVSIAK